MSKHKSGSVDPRLKGMDVRFGGRTIEVRVYVNTDETDETVLLRVRDAARGPKQCMAIAMGGEVDAESAAGLWNAAIHATNDYVRKGVS